ncbi:General transcription factor II-I repeat domain-containing protein 2B [Melipona quadrifasciata]|uniref:General transcription factor II-I repeat domain-containing protein 2B n=1 Tax=Melipona quadrifasciata TaxID=166423 RepID=A0A0M8ZXW7_9HYME|nr:General transcription factor II-I repeat domain-containing protein 2B [Melipona quadrifasciata]
MYPETVDLFSSVSLSARTTARRVEDIGSHIKSQLKDKAKNFMWFSLAVDESTDTVKLFLFVRVINTEFEVIEILASVNSLHATTTGEDIFKEVELRLVTKFKTSGYTLYNCNWVIIHQQVLSRKHLNLSCVIEPVVSTVNFIRSCTLNHHQFRDFLLEIETEYPDLLYHHTEILWLSNGELICEMYFIVKSYRRKFALKHIEELPSELQLEVTDAQNDTIRMMFKEMDLTQFYKYLPEDKYGQLKSCAPEFISVFGSTYQCEKTFSKMKYVKSQYRSLLTDDHLQTNFADRN